MLHNYISTRKNLEHTVFLQRSNGIVEVEWADDFIYEVEHVQENYEHLKSLFKKKKLLVLNCFAPYTQISAEARHFLAKGVHSGFVKMDAFVICSLAQSLTVRFFIKMDEPIVPACCFVNKKEAEEWLLSFDPGQYQNKIDYLKQIGKQ